MVEGTMPLWDWGLKPEDISQHVDLFYGEADGILDPTMSQHLGARLPDPRLERGRSLRLHRAGALVGFLTAVA